MFYDSNDIQLSTETDAVTSEDVAKKYEAWHWKVMTIDGNDYIIGDKCNVILALGKNANLDLVNEGDDYTLYQTSARSAANLLKGYNLTGKGHSFFISDIYPPSITDPDFTFTVFT